MIIQTTLVNGTLPGSRKDYINTRYVKSLDLYVGEYNGPTMAEHSPYTGKWPLPVKGAATHRTEIYLDEFYDLFTEAKDNALHASTSVKIKRARRSLNYSKHRPFDVSTDPRVSALLNAAVTDSIITASVRTTVKKGVPL